MAWLRVDDTFAEHRKMVQLERGERWTWMEVLLYCARQRNDGQVPVGISDVLRHVDDKFLAKCVQVGLLDRSRTGALKVHDWSVYNPKDRTAAERMARHRERNAAVTATEIDRNENGASRAAARAQPVPSPTHEEQEVLQDVSAVRTRPGPLDRLLEVLHDKDEGTKNVLLALHRNFKLSEGDFEYARECATGPGVNSPTKVAIAELKKRVAARA